VDCVRRGTARARVPLSAFANDTGGVAGHLLPAFAEAAAVVPPHYHSRTRVLYQATAGMRLLSSQDQESVYDALHRQLSDSPEFPFRIRRADVATLSGDDEGFFGAVAANYLEGTIRADLTLRRGPGNKDGSRGGSASRAPSEIVGALDMGGSSTQIVFLPSSSGEDSPASTAEQQPSSADCGRAAEDPSARLCPAAPPVPANSTAPPIKLQTDGFFINSYLSYGVDQFRERLWRRWIERHRADVAAEAQSGVGSCDTKLLDNPCVFRGYTIDFEGYTLVGTGQARACVERVREFLREDSSPVSGDGRRGVGGVEHPPVRGKFYAMSNYFYTLDSVRKFVSEAHAEHEAASALAESWPTPTLHELHEALPLFCDRSWDRVLGHHEAAPHAYTLPHVLPHRCLEAAYMATLLRDGFGFDPGARDITYALDVNDSEVEWTLGMALVLRSQSRAAAEEEEEEPTSVGKDQACDNAQAEAWAEATTAYDADGDSSSPQQQQDERQNATDPATAPDEVVLSTRGILRRVARFIVTVSALDYMHTM
jgi:apyrase